MYRDGVDRGGECVGCVECDAGEERGKDWCIGKVWIEEVSVCGVCGR